MTDQVKDQARVKRPNRRAKRPVTEVKYEIKNEIKTEIGDLDGLALQPRKKPRKIIAAHPVAKVPENFEFFLEKIREMRKLREAPVDKVGCERIGARGASVDPKTVRFQHLVALMLSSQTKDEITSAAVERLRNYLPELTPSFLLTIKEPALADLICPVGFYRRKAKYLRETAQILLDKFEGDIPQELDDMTSLPGVGPKMAHLLQQSAWGKTLGIGVDVHVHRLANLWQWVPKEKNPTPEKTRVYLEAWMPRELWREINPLLVGFGQTWCPPKRNKQSCAQCFLNTSCPASLYDFKSET